MSNTRMATSSQSLLKKKIMRMEGMLSPVYITVTFSMPDWETSMSECLMFLASMAWMNWRVESSMKGTSLMAIDSLLHIYPFSGELSTGGIVDAADKKISPPGENRAILREKSGR